MPARKPKPGESFGDLYPETAKQWHPTKNGDLTPFHVTNGTYKKIWWKCNKGDDHEWYALINNRSKGAGCPICRGLKVVKSNCFATVNPVVAKEWHPTLNGDLTPYGFTPGSNKKVWWKCHKGTDHEWRAQIISRSKGRGCPVCSGNVVVGSNSLATTHPELIKEWHPTLNGDLTPNKVRYGSTKKVWWKCDKAEDHIYDMPVVSKSGKQKQGCPMCSGKRIVRSNSLATTHPELVKEWHPSKNGQLTPFDVTPGSHEKVWWKCDKGADHVWISTIKNRAGLGNGCGVCSGKVVVESTSLKTKYPDIAKQWHPTKNESILPENIYFGSNSSFWWKCHIANDHIWKTRLADRIDGHNCPMCSGNIVVNSNSLAKTNSELSKEWHPKLNGKLTPHQFTEHSGKKVWWRCERDKSHEWRAQISNRKITGCPYCELTPQSKEELIITHELITIFKGINPKGFKTRVKGKLRSIDIYIPDLKIGIEFDGSYWHKDKRDLDKLKTEELEAEGFNIIRVRQKPLKRIFEDDIMAEKKYDGKKITNDILTQIMKDYKLGQSTILKINKYVEKPDLQNEKRLEKYIDMILTEKSEKNKS